MSATSLAASWTGKRNLAANQLNLEAKAPHWRHFSLPYNLGFIRNLGM